jgi:hypothetical protein
MGFDSVSAELSKNAGAISDFLSGGSHEAFYRKSRGVSHAKWPRTTMNPNQSRPSASFAARPKRWASRAGRPEPKNSQAAQRNYERYLALARTETQIGNTVGAENYYQYAEHYLRSMSSDPEIT